MSAAPPAPGASCAARPTPPRPPALSNRVLAARLPPPTSAGFLKHFSDLDDATKYAGIDHFLSFNQPPTNDTFKRASSFDGFRLHTGSAWSKLEPTPDGKQVRRGAVGSIDARDTRGGVSACRAPTRADPPARPPAACPSPQVRITSSKGDEGLFDYLIVSTGLLTDARLRKELAPVSDHIATWCAQHGGARARSLLGPINRPLPHPNQPHPPRTPSAVAGPTASRPWRASCATS